MSGRLSLVAILFLLVSIKQINAAENWRNFTDMQGRSIEARVISIDKEKEKVTLLVKKTNRKSIVPFSNLSKEDVDFLQNWTPTESGEETNKNNEDEDKVSGRLYPQTKEEIRAKMREIGQRSAPKDIHRDVQKAVNEMNIFRYLCGVPYDVAADKKMIEQARDAAKACRNHGSLSHDLGHSTDICNLSQGTSIFGSVAGYMEDRGDSNREVRGHRRWILNPPMRKTGFGDDAQFSAMVVIDDSGGGNQKSWSYPGKGFFPKDYVHGNGWSLYLRENAPNKDQLKVEVYELKKRPEKAFSMDEEIPGTALPVPYVSTFMNTINFEPQADPIKTRGIYWVRVKGGGVSEGYLVELF